MADKGLVNFAMALTEFALYISITLNVKAQYHLFKWTHIFVKNDSLCTITNTWEYILCREVEAPVVRVMVLLLLLIG
jgi:hypothetical protein